MNKLHHYLCICLTLIIFGHKILSAQNCQWMTYHCGTDFVWQFGPGAGTEIDGMAVKFQPSTPQVLNKIKIGFYPSFFSGTPDVEVYIAPSLGTQPDLDNIYNSIIIPSVEQTQSWEVDLILDLGINNHYMII